MQGYWMKFNDGTEGYCEGQSAYDAVAIAESLTKKTVANKGENKYAPSVPTLPYPANPVIWQFSHPVHGKTPAFCWKPRECAGRTACPRNRSCTE